MELKYTLLTFFTAAILIVGTEHIYSSKGNPRQSWILDFTPWISGFKVLVSGFSVSGSRIPDFNHSRFFELHGGFPHMKRYEGIEKKLLSSVKERKCILRKQKEKNCPLAWAHSEVYFTFLTVFSKNSLSVLLYHIAKLDFSRSC